MQVGQLNETSFRWLFKGKGNENILFLLYIRCKTEWKYIIQMLRKEYMEGIVESLSITLFEYNSPEHQMRNVLY